MRCPSLAKRWDLTQLGPFGCPFLGVRILNRGMKSPNVVGIHVPHQQTGLVEDHLWPPPLPLEQWGFCLCLSLLSRFWLPSNKHIPLCWAAGFSCLQPKGLSFSEDLPELQACCPDRSPQSACIPVWTGGTRGNYTLAQTLGTRSHREKHSFSSINKGWFSLLGYKLF